MKDRIPITQLLGQAAHSVALEGLIVPLAATTKGHNLLVFPDRLLTGSQIAVVNADQLGRT